MATGAVGEPTPSAAAGRAGRERRLGGWLTLWWSQAPDGRRPCCHGRAGRGGRVRGAGGQPADRRHRGGPVPPDQSLAGGLYPPMWTAQLSGVIGALPLVAAAAALFRRLRLAAALAVAALLKVSLESVAKVFVQRGRPGL